MISPLHQVLQRALFLLVHGQQLRRRWVLKRFCSIWLAFRDGGIQELELFL
jgi:hypothetical protein